LINFDEAAAEPVSSAFSQLQSVCDFFFQSCQTLKEQYFCKGVTVGDLFARCGWAVPLQRYSSSTELSHTNTNVPTKVELLDSSDHINPMSDVEESLYQQAIEHLAERAFRAADINRDGKISFQVLVCLFVCLFVCLCCVVLCCVLCVCTS
jgi:hypothetical protein